MFDINEYVWDLVWDGPAIVVGCDDKGKVYTIAEITRGSKSLGRVAERGLSSLSRYINVAIPELETMALLGVKRLDDPKLHNAQDRIREACDRRGIEHAAG